MCLVFLVYTSSFLRTVLGTFQPSIMVDMNLTSVEFSILLMAVFDCIWNDANSVGLIVTMLG